MNNEIRMLIYRGLSKKNLGNGSVRGMQYHDKTGRLYLTTTGEPQIGYIELDKIPD